MKTITSRTPSAALISILVTIVSINIPSLHSFSPSPHRPFLHANPIRTLDPSPLTTLSGKRWDNLEIEPDTSAKWYLLNCMVGNELILLSQVNEATKDFSTEDVTEFRVPVEKIARSHGKRNVVEDLVLYPGYVFSKVKLCEEVYEELNDILLCRSWVQGGIRKKGNRKLPSVPEPLTDDEVMSFFGEGGKEEGVKEEVTEEMLMKIYEGFEVGNMVKIVDGRFKGEDGIIKRLKNKQISIRMYTYGTAYDEWFDVQDIRVMTELEIMKGFTGPEKSVNQDQFDVSIGKTPERRDSDNSDRGGSSRNLRTNLMGSMAGSGGRVERNTRKERVDRGDITNYGVSKDQVTEEDKQWAKYKKKRTDDLMDNKNTVNAQWGRPEIVDKRKNNPNDKSSQSNKQAQRAPDDDSNEEDFFNELMAELSDDGAPSTRSNTRDETVKPISKAEDNFLDSLMSDLFSDNDKSDNKKGSDQKETQPSSSTNLDQDDFFMALEKEMTEAVAPPKPSAPEKGQPSPKTMQQNDDDFFSDDDFFAGLTQEIDSDMNDYTPPPQPTEKAISKDTHTKTASKETSDSGTSSNLSQLTVPMLKEKLRGKGLKVSGKKAELIERLQES